MPGQTPEVIHHAMLFKELQHGWETALRGDAPVVESVREPPKPLAVLPDSRHRLRLVDLLQIADRAEPARLQPAPGHFADAPQSRHRQRVEKAKIPAAARRSKLVAATQ